MPTNPRARARSLALALALAASVAGCSSSSTSAPPGGSDADTTDAASDASMEAAADALDDVIDAPVDAPIDAPVDAPVDAVDAQPDAPADAIAADAADAIADATADAPATCGNGRVDPGEDCDPGPSPPPNDGCGPPGSANACLFVPAPAGEDRCPGQTVSVAPGTTVLAESSGTSTYGFTDDYVSAGCLGSAGATTGGRDRVFQITPTSSGTLTVSAGYATDGVTDPCATDPTRPDCWRKVLYARSTCGAAASELACDVGVSGTTVVPAKIAFPVTANTPYWIFVDGFDATSGSDGPFNLVVTLQ